PVQSEQCSPPIRARMRARSGRLEGSSVQGRNAVSAVVAIAMAVSLLALQWPQPFSGTYKPNQIDQTPSATSRSPVQNGSRRNSPASQSSARRAGSNSTGTINGNESARPNRASATKPLASGAPAAPPAAAAPSNANSSGAAQAGMLRPNSTPRAAEPCRSAKRPSFGPSETISGLIVPVRYRTPSAI